MDGSEVFPSRRSIGRGWRVPLTVLGRNRVAGRSQVEGLHRLPQGGDESDLGEILRQHFVQQS